MWAQIKHRWEDDSTVKDLVPTATPGSMPEDICGHAGANQAQLGGLCSSGWFDAETATPGSILEDICGSGGGVSTNL